MGDEEEFALSTCDRESLPRYWEEFFLFMQEEEVSIGDSGNYTPPPQSPPTPAQGP